MSFTLLGQRPATIISLCEHVHPGQSFLSDPLSAALPSSQLLLECTCSTVARTRLQTPTRNQVHVLLLPQALALHRPLHTNSTCRCCPALPKRKFPGVLAFYSRCDMNKPVQGRAHAQRDIVSSPAAKKVAPRARWGITVHLCTGEWKLRCSSQLTGMMHLRIC